ncbi:Histidine kinase [Sulfidibacter corallicola]|uniref:Histidine kinase n=1 Tax=Sulfidibacter corallicola TaxID=2818388 RepID=A0A8A4TI61_SULCO|nr:histidine kinase [Sulfidibacter corallicola]QTD48468.1 histidine kinase [Sulfidibacter corallicola]
MPDADRFEFNRAPPRTGPPSWPGEATLAERWTADRATLFWKAQFLGWGLYGLGSYLARLLALNTYMGMYIGPARILLAEMVRVTMAFSMTLLLHLLYRRLWARSRSYLTLGAIGAICSVGCGLALMFGFKVALLPRLIPDLAVSGPSMYLKLAFDYSMVFLAWSALYFGTRYWLDVEVHKQGLLRSEALAREAQLQMLRYQLNPHFLFNSLNSIRSLIHENPESAGEVVEELSDFLRSSLLREAVSQVTLRDEIDTLRSYLAVEKIRFEDKLVWRFEIEPETASCLLPAFLLHPLLENAVKYGMKTSPKPLRLSLSAVLREDTLHIEVANSGRWVDPEATKDDEWGQSTGLGLRNVRERLKFSYPDGHRFTVREADGWVRARISIGNPGSPP